MSLAPALKPEEMKINARWLVILVALAGLPMCGNPTAPRSYDGAWRGTTSETCESESGLQPQPCTITFDVIGDAVTAIYVQVGLRPPDTPCEFTGASCPEGKICGTLLPPVPITNSVFELGLGNFARRGNFIDSLSGQFVSPRLAQGTLHFTLPGIGTCQPNGPLSGSATWTATLP
jgi:hypothetical protein